MKKKAKKMKVDSNLITFIVVALVIGLLGGYAIGIRTDGAALGNDHQEEKEYTAESSNMKHSEQFEVGADKAPSVKVLADADAVSGWNVTLVTSNFKFAPQDVNETDVEGEGHAHIWVDGKKVGRVYGHNYHLGALGEGDHEITVTLNTNKHKDFAVDGEAISDSIDVTEEVKSESADDDHPHDGTEPADHHDE